MALPVRFQHASPLRLIPTLLLALLIAGTAPAAFGQQVIYVDDSASGANDGSSWANAYTGLQEAIDNATGNDQIWIAEGTYKPTFKRPGTVQFSYLAYRNRSFVIPDSKDGLKLYGGFNGTETALDQRDPGAHEVILSGDLGPGDDASFDPDFDSDANTNATGDIVDPVPETRSATDHLRAGLTSGPPELGWGANVNHVVFLGGGLSRSTVIDGVTITGGFAVAQFVSTSTGDFVGGEQRNFGGGLFCDGCSATMRGVTFRGNYAAARGGAVYVTGGGSPHFINSVFWGNNAGKRPPTVSNPPGDREFRFYLVSRLGDTNGQPITDQISDGLGSAVFNDGSSPDIDFSTFYQHPGGASTLENIAGDDVLFADNDAVGNDLDLDPSSPTFLQIDTETSSLVDAGSTSRLPADAEDLDGDSDTSEPLPIDARGNERIQGAAPDPGAYESPFSTAPNPAASAVPIGDRLRIEGRGVDAATAVRIGGTPATNLTGTGDGNERITVTVAEGTTSGPVEIDTPGGTITTEEPVEVTPPAYGPGQALGAPGSVEISDPSAFTFPTPTSGSSGFTVSLWTKGSFSVQKEENEPSGWGLSGSPGGEATFFVNFEGEDDAGNTIVRNVPTSISVPDDGQWHHVAATYQFNDANEGTHIAKVYVDGFKQRASRTGDDLRLTNTRRPSTNDAPVTIDAGGTLDQVRIYDRPLAESDLLTDNSTSDAAELNVRRRIHRTADLSDGQYSGLIAEYRFDSGDPNIAFDYAGRNSGTYQNSAGPVLSTAPVGQDAGANPVGPDGASFAVNGGPRSSTQFMGLYRYGVSNGSVRTSADPGEVFDSALPNNLTERAALTWGGYIERTNNANTIFESKNILALSVDTLEYANVTGISEPVGLLWRSGPGDTWRVANYSMKDAEAQTFSTPPNTVIPTGELALASFPFSDLHLTLTPETQTAAPGETITFTATLTNDGPDDVPGVTVDFDATALSGLSGSGGTFSGGTWDVGTLAGDASTNITLTATVESGADLPALRGALGLNDIDNGNNAAQAVVPASPAYGPGQALVFNGTDDALNLGPDMRLDGRDFTLSFWAKRGPTGSDQTIISQGASSDEALRIGFRSDDRFEARIGGSAVVTDNAVTDTDWHHWTVVFESVGIKTAFFSIYRDGVRVKRSGLKEVYRGLGDLFIGRAAYTNAQHFAGELDQLRIWDRMLSTGDIRARMHQRLTPGDPNAEFLLASYRFDEGSGSFAHSAGQGPLATFEGDPQWVPFSAARLGKESAVATSSTDASIGPAGAQLSATGASGDVQLYRYGDASAPLRTESDAGEDLSGLPTSVTKRSHLTWGVSTPSGTSPTATLTLDYSDVTAPQGPLALVHRAAPGQPWQIATGWTKDPAAQTFTRTGTVPVREYALIRNTPPSLSVAQATPSLAENSATPAAVTEITVQDDGVGSSTLALAGPDADAFALDGSTLQLTATPDFETMSTYVVDVTADDPSIGTGPEATTRVTLSITDVNEAPTAVALTPADPSVAENTASPAGVATVAVTDDALGTNNLSLGGTDAGAFRLDGTTLQLTQAANFEAKNSYTLSVSVDDPAVGGTPDATRSFTVAVSDVNEAPSVGLSVTTTSIAEDADPTAPVALSTVDVQDDALGTNALTLAGADASSFQLDGFTLQLKAGVSLNVQTKDRYTVRVTVDDPGVGSTPDDDALFTLNITDVNSAPTLTLTPADPSIAENNTPPTDVATVTINDDNSGTNNLSLGGTDAGAFQLDGTTLQLTEAANFEAKSSYALSVSVDDPAVGGTPDASRAVTVAISDVNDPPSVSAVGTLAVTEGTAGTVSPTILTATDPEDAPAALTYTVTTAPAHGTLQVEGNMASAFTQADVNAGRVAYRHDGSETTTDAVTLSLKDAGGAQVAGVTVPVSITAANDAPTISGIPAQTIVEDAPLGPVSFTVDDPEAAASTLTVTATSDNEALVPDANITLGGEAANRTVAVTPAANASGTATLTVTVDDGAAANNTRSTSFALTVTAVPDIALTDGSAQGLDFSAAVSPGTADNPVGLLQLGAGQEGATLEGLTVTNRAPGVAGITAARLYWSADAVLEPSSDRALAEVSTDASSAPVSIAFTGFSQAVPATPGYAFLALDVAAGAAATGVQFELSQPSDLSLAGGELAAVNGTAQSTFAALPLSNGTVALPVEFADFEAQSSDAGIALAWRTASETNNAGFAIQRAVWPPRTDAFPPQDGSTRPDGPSAWQEVGFVAGAGTTTNPQSYRFADATVPFAADSLTYRLKQMDTDGSVSFSKQVTVRRGAVQQLRLLGTFPNPARTRATVRFAIPNGPKKTAVRLVLYDVLGRQVRTVRTKATAGRHELQLRVGGLASGLYFLRLQAGGRTQTQKITVVQ